MLRDKKNLHIYFIKSGIHIYFLYNENGFATMVA